jgi:hypothetical protein
MAHIPATLHGLAFFYVVDREKHLPPKLYPGRP